MGGGQTSFARARGWVAGSTREVSGNLYPGIRAVSTYPGDCGSTRIWVSGQKAERASSLCIRAEQAYPGRPIRAKQAIRVSGRNLGIRATHWSQLVPAGTSWYQLVTWESLKIYTTTVGAQKGHRCINDWCIKNFERERQIIYTTTVVQGPLEPSPTVVVYILRLS